MRVNAISYNLVVSNHQYLHLVSRCVMNSIPCAHDFEYFKVSRYIFLVEELVCRAAFGMQS